MVYIERSKVIIFNNNIVFLFLKMVFILAMNRHAEQQFQLSPRLEVKGNKASFLIFPISPETIAILKIFYTFT